MWPCPPAFLVPARDVGAAGRVPPPDTGIFGTTGETHALVVFFRLFAAGSFLFNGAVLVPTPRSTTSATPVMRRSSTGGGRRSASSLRLGSGSIYLARWHNPPVWGLVPVAFKAAAIVVCLRVPRRLERDGGSGGVGARPEAAPVEIPAAQSPFSTGKRRYPEPLAREGRARPPSPLTKGRNRRSPNAVPP